MKTLFYILSFLFCFGASTQNEALFEKGNTLYNAGKYTEAIDYYNAILETKVHSADLYFNLANAHYKLNNVAPSIYYYEKALLLNPKDADIKNNIAFANNMTIDAIGVLPEVGFSSFLNKTSNSMSFDGWAILTVVLVFCFVLLFLGYYFAYSTLNKRLIFIGSNLALIIACITLGLAFHKYNLEESNNPAIIFAQEAKVKAEPNLRSEESFKLHEGAKVHVTDTVDDWKKIELTDGKIGWVKDKNLKLLKDF